MRLSIGELARRTGVKVVTIRWYEAQGVIAACDRTAGGNRLFDGEALERLVFVRRARDLGFSLEEVRDLLRLADAEPGAPGVAEQASRHLARAEDRAADLDALRLALDGLARRDPSFVPGAVVQALAGAADG